MNIQLYETIRLLSGLLNTIFSKRVILVGEPTHPNLGDQAQLMCTENWLRDSYPDRKIVRVGMLFSPFDCSLKGHLLSLSSFKLVFLKLFVKSDDIFIGHSGYFFVDHHKGWFAYMTLLNNFTNSMIILPQTVNFYAPVVKQLVSRSFSFRDNLTILCRDKVSYSNSQILFRGITLFLYPDIVTSLIGTKQYNHKRDGVLFCMRNDIEKFYSYSDIESLISKFGDIRIEMTDTTLKNENYNYLKKNRDILINSTIEHFATFQVVITDRYHGTIFSAIASTPVVVIGSTDHKLSSGVEWFKDEGYGDMVQFAKDLDEAYILASSLLNAKQEKQNPPYFKDRYWSKLVEKLQ